MSAQEQQEQELEALEAIYSEGELEILNREYPEISLQITLKSNQFGEPEDDDFTVELGIKFTENYPDEIPEITIDGIDEEFEEIRIFEAIEKMKAVAEENLGMVMVFAIVSAMQEEIGELLNVKKAEKDKVLEIEKEAKEAESRKKFEGTVVTPDSFRAWKEKFDAERKAANESAEKERLAALAGRLTGRQLFLKDATLNLSDMTLIGAQDEVEIDESLFDNEEFEGLDIESDEEEEED
ncbi:unnamed protein product [Caenorhabditis angaria]|uniref:RWD domain-containing protein n=1 Tax=Caenorhabditis angaria TaxID=860376 RepID=A0A9P1I3E2_9PELO|nr:unnamed protein product [Caenorhabditis angaria]